MVSRIPDAQNQAILTLLWINILICILIVINTFLVTHVVILFAVAFVLKFQVQHMKSFIGLSIVNDITSAGVSVYCILVYLVIYISILF